jgi:hypothetical protein
MDSFINKVTKGTKQAATQMSLAAKIAKLNVEVATQKTEKERHVKAIGAKVYAIFAKNKQLDGKLVEEEISGELNLIARIDRHIDDLQQQISQLQTEFRHLDGKPDIVDATDVKEAPDPTKDDTSNH